MNKDTFQIVVVDDEPTIVNIVSRFLSRAGYSCQTFTDSTEVPPLIKEQDIDLLISDVKMPKLDGVELAEIASVESPHTKVILMTGYAEYRLVSEAIKLRPIAYLEKPLQPADLIRYVDQAYADAIANSNESQYKDDLERTIEERRRELEFASERLAAEKSIMHGVISEANFGLVAVDDTGLIHLMNPYFADMFGLGDLQLTTYLGIPFNDLIGVEVQAWFETLSGRVRGDDCLQEQDFTLDSKEKRLNILAYPLHYQGRLSAIVFIVHDITEKENLHRRLLQTAKLASIGELAAGVAHEINNPLGFVTSNCNTLNQYVNSLLTYVGGLDGYLKEKYGGQSVLEGDGQLAELRKSCEIDYITQDAADMIKETLDGLARVSKIVLDLKSFARVDSDEPQKGDINSLLDDALNLVRNEIKYTLEVERNYEDLPTLSCFPNQLVQVFTNLFVNASHAVKEKGILRVSTSARNQGIEIRIADDGVGIPERVLPRIFDPFFTTKETGKGTGMGLSISYGIIQKHGGTITVNSVEGEGTEFTIRLPLDGVATESREVTMA